MSLLSLLGRYYCGQVATKDQVRGPYQKSLFVLKKIKIFLTPNPRYLFKPQNISIRLAPAVTKHEIK